MVTEWLGFVTAIFLGALIGLQREYEQRESKVKRFAGIRTFTIISMLGALMGYASVNLNNYALAIVGFIAVLLFASVSYVITYLKYKDNTSTTEISAVIIYVLGLLCATGFVRISVIAGVLLAVVLTFKEQIHELPEHILKNELFAVVQFALVSLVILPLIPNKSYSPLDWPAFAGLLRVFGVSDSIMGQLNIFNFYQIWFMVMLISGIGFLGYLLVKFLGARKGYGLTGIVGAFASSTAVTLSMSTESKKYPQMINPLVMAVVLAGATCYIKMIIEVIVINSGLLRLLIVPFGLMGLVGYVSAFLLYLKDRRKEKKEDVEKIKLKQPFAIVPALKFGLFFVFVIILTKVLQIVAGSAGLYLASIVSGIADVDAITLTMSSLSKTGSIANSVAVASIVLAAASNTVVKAVMTWMFGEKKFAMYISIIFLIILILGIGAVFLL
jgi:uncharacterized membrane protein (DUF4010 family)